VGPVSRLPTGGADGSRRPARRGDRVTSAAGNGMVCQQRAQHSSMLDFANDQSAP
jgi:hypothetical protein